MKLPNESLLQVFHFADYKALVLAKLAGIRFLRIITKFAEELARRRIFHVDFYTTCVKYFDVTIGTEGNIHYELGNESSLATACRDLHEAIGSVGVAVLTFYGNTWNMLGIDAVFEAAPALKCAQDVALHSPFGSDIRDDSEAFMSQFAVMKSLHLWLSYGVFCDFSWTFLRQESARKLRRIKVYAEFSAWRRNGTNRAVEALVRDCATLPRLLGNQGLELDFSDVSFSYSFGRRIIELLRNSERELTFRMQTLRDDGELRLDESDYTVDVADGTTRYASEESGIAVKVKGRSVAIQSIAEKRSRGTNEEVSRMVPLVE